MSDFLQYIANINSQINSFIWGKLGLVLLIGSGLFLSIILSFFQFKYLKLWFSKTIGYIFSKNAYNQAKDTGDISPFQVLCTTLAATIGTGNIAGVATAITIGGPGAIFWMWVATLLGMITSFSENILGIYFRRRNSENEWSGGAMYYLQDGFGAYKHCKKAGKILAYLFAFFAILASLGTGNISQTNKIAENIVSAFPIHSLTKITLYSNISLYSLIIGIVCFFLIGMVILGGLKRTAKISEALVPFMVMLYLFGSLAIILINYSRILPAITAIFSTAFYPKAMAGGGIGFIISTVIVQGFKRGVFSNEAGLGSSVMINSNSSLNEPVSQGMWGISEVFIDTIIVCTLTALVVLTSGVYDLQNLSPIAGISDSTMVGEAFNTVFAFGNIGKKFIAISIFLFSFTTLLGWSHYGSKCTEYIWNEKKAKLYRVIFVFFSILGTLMTSSLAWDISDTFNGLMMIPNLIGVLSLFPLVRKITANYIDRRIKGNTKVKPLLSYNETIQKEAEVAVKNGSD